MTKLNLDNLFFFYNNYQNIEFQVGSIEHAYLSILSDELTAAKYVFSQIDAPRSNWGYAFTSILEGYMTKYPTYFQIRNFMEIDLDFLLKNKKINYVEQFLGSLDILSAINQETYKYAARVMYENKLYSAAQKYMEKSKEIFYNDAELHFMLAKYYLKYNKLAEAKFYINECLNLIPDYYPAQKMLKVIEEIDI